MSKQVQNFDEVTDIWLETFFSFSTSCHLEFIVNHMKINITIADNLRWLCYNLPWLSLSEQLVQKQK